MPASRFSGVFPMLYAFFDSSGKLDRRAFSRQVEAVIGAGADGVAVLGLITEVASLTLAERMILIEWTLEEVGARAPVVATIFGRDLEEAVAGARHAEKAGASAVVFQPPAERPLSSAALKDFFAAAMASVELPCGVQNAPEFLGVGLSPAEAVALAAERKNFALIKAEGPLIVVKPMIEATRGRLAAFAGRGGLELIDNLRAGAEGVMPAPDCADFQAKLYKHFLRDELAEAEALYALTLPYVVFAMQSLSVAIACGKRMFAARAGIDNDGRCRAVPPIDDGFFLEITRRWADRFGPYTTNNLREPRP